MSFELLKQVILHLKKMAHCQECKSKFTDSSVFVLATNTDAASNRANGLFFIVCPKCHSQTFLFAELFGGMRPNMPISDASIRVSTKPASGVSSDDILDMHNFLKNFKGDVHQLFNKL